MSIGTDHRWSTEQINALNIELDRRGLPLFVQSQQPLTLPEMHEPEPDGAFVVGTRESYRGRKPTASDVTCVVEVADSSLDYDRTTKQRIYNSAGIKQYVVINLVDKVLEVFDGSSPDSARYINHTVVSREG